MTTDIFSDRRTGSDRRQEQAPPPGGACRRKSRAERRAPAQFVNSWWLRADYVESDVLIRETERRHAPLDT